MKIIVVMESGEKRVVEIPAGAKVDASEGVHHDSLTITRRIGSNLRMAMDLHFTKTGHYDGGGSTLPWAGSAKELQEGRGE